MEFNQMKKRGRGVGCNLYGIGYGFNRPDHAAAMVDDERRIGISLRQVEQLRQLREK